MHRLFYILFLGHILIAGTPVDAAEIQCQAHVKLIAASPVLEIVETASPYVLEYMEFGHSIDDTGLITLANHPDETDVAPTRLHFMIHGSTDSQVGVCLRRNGLDGEEFERGKQPRLADTLIGSNGRDTCQLFEFELEAQEIVADLDVPSYTLQVQFE